MTKILVTGGLGFIGNNLIEKLLEKGGYDVRVFDIDTADKAVAYNIADVEFVQGDLRDPEALKQAVQGIDTVIHLAAHTRVVDSMENPRENFEVNAVGTFNLLEAMKAQGVESILGASTGGAILGEAKPPVHEEMPAKPLSPYGASKLAAEGYFSAFAGAYGMKTASLRFSNVYGRYSGAKGSVVPLFISKILAGEDLVIYGDGEQTRDFLFASDLAEGIIQAMEAEVTGVYQLGTNVGTTINHTLELLKQAAGDMFQSNVEYVPSRQGEVILNVCDIAKAQKSFGYNPPTSVDEGVPLTYQWFIENEEQAKIQAA